MPITIITTTKYIYLHEFQSSVHCVKCNKRVWNLGSQPTVYVYVPTYLLAFMSWWCPAANWLERPLSNSHLTWQQWTCDFGTQAVLCLYAHRQAELLKFSDDTDVQTHIYCQGGSSRQRRRFPIQPSDVCNFSDGSCSLLIHFMAHIVLPKFQNGFV
jgi:hypothetical protein